MSIITLTTDFGLADGYVGAMKGVILSIAPMATIVDISHDVAPQDVRGAAYVLYAACPHFPAESVHLGVIDPGVGGQRQAIAVQTERATFVAPNNGVLSYVLADQRVTGMVSLTNLRYQRLPVSHTFHGRDIFAPAAAYLVRGISLAELGPPLSEIITFPLPRPQRRADGTLVGQVIHIDRFGNLITSIRDRGGGMPMGDEMVVEVEGRTVTGIRHTFASVPVGELVAYLGSSGHVEIAVRQGDAAHVLGVQVGDEVVVRET